MTWLNKIHVGDCRALMREMIADGVKAQCVVSSPPYWGLRDYDVAGQYGLERSWIRHVARMRATFRLVRDILEPSGVLWLNYGDSYAGAPGGFQGKNGQRASRTFTARIDLHKRGEGIKPKDLIGMPWRIAFALQADGWWLRSDVIWHKPNPMPESVTDRPTTAHEHVFLFAKSDQYFYDARAIRETASQPARVRADRIGGNKYVEGVKHSDGFIFNGAEMRNARSVWTLPLSPFAGAHFATFPRELVRRCILAGSKPGDVVFDPFMGSGTVAEVALSLGRQFIGCELNPEYAAMFESHRSQQLGLQLI
jgi:DNA modification methylase